MAIVFPTVTDKCWGDLETESTPVTEAEPNTEVIPQVKILFISENIRQMRIVLAEKTDQLERINAAKMTALCFPPIGGETTQLEDDYSQAIYELEVEIDELEHVIEDMTKDYYRLYKEIHAEKLAFFKEQRQAITEIMDKLMVDQHDHYKLQKERFEACKLQYGKNHTRFFPEKDQEFISNHRAANEACWSKWLELQAQREFLCQQIEEIDPDDPDY